MHYWDANDRKQEPEDRPADDGSLPSYTLRRLKRVPIIHETANGPDASGLILRLRSYSLGSSLAAFASAQVIVSSSIIPS